MTVSVINPTSLFSISMYLNCILQQNWAELFTKPLKVNIIVKLRADINQSSLCVEIYLSASVHINNRKAMMGGPWFWNKLQGVVHIDQSGVAHKHYH